MSSQYYTLIDGKVFGPFDVQKVRLLITQGKVDKNTDIRIGEDTWTKAGGIDLFFDQNGNPIPFVPAPPLPGNEVENLPRHTTKKEVLTEDGLEETLEVKTIEHSYTKNNGKKSHVQLLLYARASKFFGWMPLLHGGWCLYDFLIDTLDLNYLGMYIALLYAFISFTTAFAFFVLSSCLTGFASIVEYFETSEKDR